MIKFFKNKKQLESTSIPEDTTSTPISIPPNDKLPKEEFVKLPLDELTVYKEALNYVVARTSPNSVNDIEILYPINVPKEFVNHPESEKIEIIKDHQITNINELSGEEEAILHAIYSKQVIRQEDSPLYHCLLRQVYNDFIIGEAKRISLVGEPLIIIHTLQMETELRRTGTFSNTWHFGFEGRDYRWKPTLFGSKDSDLICELIEYDLSLVGSGIGKKKKKEVIASLKRKHEDWNMIGDLCILKNAWRDVRDHRSLEIVLVLCCLIMLDIIES
ncbi:9035_t:CDS:1 [Funneliformis geosporum]|uniref:1837_t:CDS:1 n=1 Tax=Funneliformis geosporum TaxID=1117311 RepID=A0A9W4WVN5_9GLOM|nr:1837_t:CDS:1 [Funneliformis geosporum]CAI2176543.1 9035_t:CDS:1 [Funneliformis geosporum]